MDQDRRQDADHEPGHGVRQQTARSERLSWNQGGKGMNGHVTIIRLYYSASDTGRCLELDSSIGIGNTFITILCISFICYVDEI